MKQTINKSQFHDAFNSCRPDSFSYEGLNALYDYFVEYEESCDTEIELDVIAIDCEYAEDSITNVLENYNLESLEELQDHTQVIVVDDETIIYQVY